ncbi:MAG TPA: tyrosine-type recombinase/integrase [Terriglobales bacterium]|nr:tyrosine-type recombinase/integrase [Terriglobales bacterium]
METSEFRMLTFATAFPIWLASRTHLSDGSRQDYLRHFKRLFPFFGELRLDEIRIDHIQEYRQRRLAEITKRKGHHPERPGASRINHELNTVQQVLALAGCWKEMEPWYKPLPLPESSPGRALTREEFERLFRMASTNKRWRVAYVAALLTANTTAGPGELRMLRLGDVDLEKAELHIRQGIKNPNRKRDIPLNQDALWAARQAVERARRMGATRPEHYLFPHRAHAQGAEPDPMRPMGSWKKAWYALRTAAGLPGLRQYDLRHHAITALLEIPSVSERTVMDIAGHVSNEMLKRYSHIRVRTRREAVEALTRQSKSESQAQAGQVAIIPAQPMPPAPFWGRARRRLPHRSWR